MERRVWNAGSFYPVGEAKCFALEREETVAAKVSVLFGGSSPSAVAWLIAAVVIDPIDGVLARRFRAHISEKVSEVMPRLAYGNAPSAIDRIALVLQVHASLLHAMPCLVFRRLSVCQRVVAMLRRAAFIVQATATLCASCFERIGDNPLFTSALAAAFPVDASPATYFRFSGDGQPAKRHAGKVMSLDWSGHVRVIA